MSSSAAVRRLASFGWDLLGPSSRLECALCRESRRALPASRPHHTHARSGTERERERLDETRLEKEKPHTTSVGLSTLLRAKESAKGALRNHASPPSGRERGLSSISQRSARTSTSSTRIAGTARAERASRTPKTRPRRANVRSLSPPSGVSLAIRVFGRERRSRHLKSPWSVERRGFGPPRALLGLCSFV